MRITHASAQGPRSAQEDRRVIEQTGNSRVLAIFDGHGGADAAEAAASALPVLARLLEARPIEELFSGLVEVCQSSPTGTTATIVRITGNRLEYGVMGDSPLALRKADGRVFVGPSHNVATNRAEREAAIARGGMIDCGYVFTARSYAGLQMTRALGDGFMGTVLLREPETGTLEVGPGDVLILASDGVLYEGEDLALLFAFDSADAIVADALRRRTHDNVSAIRVAF